MTDISWVFIYLVVVDIGYRANYKRIAFTNEQDANKCTDMVNEYYCEMHMTDRRVYCRKALCGFDGTTYMLLHNSFPGVSQNIPEDDVLTQFDFTLEEALKLFGDKKRKLWPLYARLFVYFTCLCCCVSVWTDEV